MAKGHKDKVAVITGAANGIGQAFAKRLAEDGVHIAIADIAPGDETVKMVEQAGRQALACQCDVTSEQSVAAMAAEVQKKVRPLRHPHQLRRHLSAAGLRADEIRGLAPRAVDQSRQRVPGQRGIRARHEAARLGPRRQSWRRARSAASSPASCITCRARPASSASPGRWRRELGPYGITVNAISPGLTRSPGTLARKPRPGIADMEAEFNIAASMQAIKRVEVPDDLVGTVSYLTSDDAAFITGQTLNVDGGRVRS